MNEEINPENMRIHSRADELIACLEGEIAKRDARIVELEADLAGTQSRVLVLQDQWRQIDAELAALKAQEPVAWTDGAGAMYSASLMASLNISPGGLAPLYAAPVSEAKAQGVVMPERWNVPRPMWKDARQPYGNPLNHADIEAAEKFNLALDEVARLNAAPAAPAADAGLAVSSSGWFSLVMNAAAELETASYSITDPDAKRVAQSGADYYRSKAKSAQVVCLPDAKAIIDGLRGEVADLRSMLATVSKAGLRVRTERDQQAQRIGELEGLLRHAQKQVPKGSGLHMRIDAALSAGKEVE